MELGRRMATGELRPDFGPTAPHPTAGATLVTAGLSLLVYTLVDANDTGWGSTQTIGLGALAVALLVAFIAIEARTKYPLMPFSIFRLRTLRGSNVIGLLLGMSLFSMFFFISLYLQQVLGYDALKAGVAYLPLAFTIIFSAGMDQTAWSKSNSVHSARRSSPGRTKTCGVILSAYLVIA